MIRTEDLHWAAGFLDGEGCFHTSKQGQIAVTAAQNYRESLDKLVSLFGGKIYARKRYQENQKDGWLYSSSSQRRGAGIMMTLYPLLSPYRQRCIEKALTRWKARPAFGANRRICKRGHNLYGDNVYVTSMGYRQCKTCQRTRVRKWRGNAVEK